MKILQIIHDLDTKYDASQSYCSYFLDTLEAKEDSSKLTAISTGMTKVINNLSPEDKKPADCFLSAVNSLNSLLGILCTPEDVTHKMYKWFENHIEANNLETFSRALNDFKSLYTPQILSIFKETLLSEVNLGYAPFVKLNTTGVIKYQGVLKGYYNAEGMDRIGFCFTTSKEDLTACIKRKKYPESPFYPFVITKSSALYDNFIGNNDGVLPETHLGIEVPLIVKNK